MRFITEFESTYEGYGHPEYKKYVSAYEDRGRMELGNLISESFGWKEDEQRFKIQHTLEIEAFPMDKWIEFRKKILINLPLYDNRSAAGIMNALEELESFGKPKQLIEPEYRGPGSHCKACEDERNGIKHIVAQKHTCKK